MQFDKEKFELVYCTPNTKDGELKTLSTLCVEKGWRLVLIIPTCQKYSSQIVECFSILGDDLLIYEMAMGMGVVLESRAKKYVEYNKNSTLYDRNAVYNN
jgi:hypothetical protein